MMEGRCAGGAGKVNEPQSGGSWESARKEARGTGGKRERGKKGNTREITRGTAWAVTPLCD